jgi:hypothetical protein
MTNFPTAAVHAAWQMRRRTILAGLADVPRVQPGRERQRAALQTKFRRRTHLAHFTSSQTRLAVRTVATGDVLRDLGATQDLVR